MHGGHGTYTLKDIHTEGHIHGGDIQTVVTCTRWNARIYIRWGLHMEGDTHSGDRYTERHIHGESYTRRDLYMGGTYRQRDIYKKEQILILFGS